MKKKQSVISDGRKILKIFSGLGYDPRFYFLGMALTLVTVFFEAVSFMLLPPLLKGLLGMDFDFVQRIIFFRILAGRFPFLFADTFRIFLLLLGVIYVCSLAKNLLAYWAKVVWGAETAKFTLLLRQKVFERYLTFGKLFFDGHNLGHIYVVITNYSKRIASQLKAVESYLMDLLSFLFYVAFMFYLSWPMTLVVVAVYLLQSRVNRWMEMGLGEYSTKMVSLGKQISKFISNVILCISLVKTCRAEQSAARELSSLSMREFQLMHSENCREAIVRPIQETMILTMFCLFLLAIFSMARHDPSGHLSKYLVYFYLMRISGKKFSGILQHGISWARIYGPLTEIFWVFDDEGKAFVRSGKKEFSGLREAIRIRGVNFAYVPGLRVLKDVSFEIRKGKMTALVGSSGAGKSTLIHLLLRLYDFGEGSIVFDDTDIREYGLDSLARHMSFVGQEAVFFNDTIRHNMIYGLAREVPGDELIFAARAARLYELIQSLPCGFETVIGDRGVRLSGGEKQRLAIARAMLRRTEILILDEATSSLDTKTEILIQEAVEEMVKGHTTIVIAHRLSTIRHADWIVVLEKGEVAEQGKLDELLAMEGKFYGYWKAQMFH